MDQQDAQDLLKALMVTSGRLERLGNELEQKAHGAQLAILETRAQEEVRFKQAMASLFEEQQRLTEAALQPKITRAWQLLAALAGIGVLIFCGYLMLLKQAHARLSAADQRASAAEVNAAVQEASRHVEITSCGGRPCIRIDDETPTWKQGDNAYVLVDGKSRNSKSSPR